MFKKFLGISIILCSLSFNFPVMASENIPMVMPTIISIGNEKLNEKVDFIVNGNIISGITKGDYKNGCNVIDDKGNIYFINSEKIAEINTSYYNENGYKRNPLKYKEELQEERISKINNNENIIFEDFNDFINFVNFYGIYFGDNQNIEITGMKDTDTGNIKVEGYKFKEINFDKKDFEDLYQDLLFQINQLNKNSDYNLENMIQNVITIVDNYYEYDENFFLESISTSLFNKKGVCYHYAKLTKELFDKIGLESEFIMGIYNNQSHIWLRVFDNENQKWIYCDPTASDSLTIENYYNIDYINYINLYDSYKIFPQ